MAELKKPLVIYWKQLGDVLLLEPTLAKLTSVFPAGVILATRDEFDPLISLMEGVELAPKRILKNISYVISFDHRLRACFRAFFCSSTSKHLIVSNPRDLKWWHKLFFNERSVISTLNKYRARYFFDAIGVRSKVSFRPPKLRHPPGDWRRSELPSRYILIHPTSAWKRKAWPLSSWVKVIDSLQNMNMGPFVLSGGKDPWELDYNNALITELKGEVLNLTGNTNLKEYLSMIYHADLVISVDGSVAHIAAAFERPVITLFGPSDPIQWFCPSKTSHLIDARQYDQNLKPQMSSIPPQVVIDEIAKVWNLVH